MLIPSYLRISFFTSAWLATVASAASTVPVPSPAPKVPGVTAIPRPAPDQFLSILPGEGVAPDSQELLEQDAADHPDVAAAHIRLAHFWFRRHLRSPDEIMAEFDRAESLAPHDPTVPFGRALVFEHEKDRLGAIAAYKRVTELDPSWAEAWYRLAAVLATDGEMLDEALAALERADVGAGRPLVAYAKGLIYEAKSDRTEDAIRAYRDAIRLDNLLMPARVHLIRLLQRDPARVDEMIIQLKYLTEYAPNDGTAWSNLAGAYLTAKEYRAARDAADRAVRVEPGFFQSYFMRGNARLRLGDQAGARDDLDRAIKLDAKRYQLWTCRAEIRSIMGDHTGALQDLAEAVRLAENEPGVYRSRALQHQAMGNLAAALADFQRALDMKIRNPAHVRLAAFFAARRLGGTQAAHFVASEANGDITDAWQLRLLAFARGEIDEAQLLNFAKVDDYRRTKENLCEGYYNVGEMHLALGDTPGARANFERCVAVGVTTFVEHRMAIAELACMDKR